MHLPNRPFTVSSAFVWKNLLGGVFMLLAGIAMAIGFAYMQIGAVRQLFQQSEIWAKGMPAPRADVSGKVTSHDAILHDYKLDVEYTDARHVTHQEKLEFSTLFGTMKQNGAPKVRYLESDPSRFALSWAIESKTSRWNAIVFLLVVGVGLLGGACGLLGYQALVRVIDAKRCAQRSDELHLPITKVVAHHVNGRHRKNIFHFNLPLANGTQRACKVSFPVKYQPLVADAKNRSLMVLLSAHSPNRPCVPRSDFYPFLFSPADAAAVRSKIAATEV